MGAIKRLAGLGIGLFAPFQHFIDPRNEFPVCVVGMHDDSNTIILSHQLGMACSRNSAHNTCSCCVLDALAGKELCTAIRKLNDDVRTGICSGFKGGIHRAGRCDIDGGKGVTVLLTGSDKVTIGRTGNNTGFNGRHVGTPPGGQSIIVSPVRTD